jgi:hypothetical protein
MDGWIIVKLDGVEFNKGKLVEDNLDKDEPNKDKIGLVFEWDPTCLI